MKTGIGHFFVRIHSGWGIVIDAPREIQSKSFVPSTETGPSWDRMLVFQKWKRINKVAVIWWLNSASESA
jgi:hypothetical protein